MLRLSSQSKSTPCEDVADTSATGICTSPKLIAPFQIARAMVVYSRVMCSGDPRRGAKVSAGCGPVLLDRQLVLHLKKEVLVNKSEPRA
jgi:hypothetical protein